MLTKPTVIEWEKILKIEFSGVLDFLNDWSKDHKLVETALASCSEALKNYIQEEEELGFVPLNGYSIDEILFHLDELSLVYNDRLLEYPFIETKIGLYVAAPGMNYFGNEDQIGHYRLITTLDGEVDDDYLEINEVSSDVQLLPIVFEMVPFKNNDARNHFLGRFSKEAIENNDLQFGGGGTGDVWSGIAEPAVPLKISKKQVKEVESWMENQPEIRRFKVGPVMQDDEVVRKQRQDPDFPTLES